MGTYILCMRLHTYYTYVLDTLTLLIINYMSFKACINIIKI